MLRQHRRPHHWSYLVKTCPRYAPRQKGEGGGEGGYRPGPLLMLCCASLALCGCGHAFSAGCQDVQVPRKTPVCVVESNVLVFGSRL